MRVHHGQGISFDLNGFNIGLDSYSCSTDLVFLSHAHMDHLVRPKKPVITSNLNADLARHRAGYDYELISNFPDFKLINSGHVAGSKALFVKGEESLFYTGDFSPHDRLFLKGLKPRKCDTLIIEATYGLPEYDFPYPKETIKEARDVIEDDLSSGHNIVLWGYALGKAQLLTKMVEGLTNVFAHSSIRGVNNVCRNHGLDLPVLKPFSKKLKNFIYLTPSRKELESFTNAKTYSFTGWGANGVSDCFRLSDHAGFTDLIRFVKVCRPKQVFTHHGFSEEFASLLRTEGINAKPF